MRLLFHIEHAKRGHHYIEYACLDIKCSNELTMNLCLLTYLLPTCDSFNIILFLYITEKNKQ